MEIFQAYSKDYDIFYHSASVNKPLDVHTPYTYWVVLNLFNDCCFYIKENDEIIGTIMCVKNNKKIFIWQIAVMEKYRKKGYSHKLYDCVFNYAKNNNYRKICLSINPQNENSYYAIQKYCLKHNYSFIKSGNVDINLPQINFEEFEDIFEINIANG